MFGIEKTKNNIPMDQLKQAGDKLGFTGKELIKYPCRNKDGTLEYTPVWELTEEYKRNQIRFHKNRISESEHLISLLQ